MTALAIDVKQKTKDSVYLLINGDMTIYTASDQKQQLLDYLRSTKQAQIDLSGVTEIDSAGIQLLMFLKQEALLGNIQLALIHHSKAVVEVLELLNLSKFFGDLS